MMVFDVFTQVLPWALILVLTILVIVQAVRLSLKNSKLAKCAAWEAKWHKAADVCVAEKRTLDAHYVSLKGSKERLETRHASDKKAWQGKRAELEEEIKKLTGDKDRLLRIASKVQEVFDDEEWWKEDNSLEGGHHGT